MRFSLLGSAILVLIAAGCESDRDSGAGEAGAGSVAEFDPRELVYAPCPAETEVGKFTILLDAEYTSVGGKVWDGVDPNLVPAELMTDGSCKLMAPPERACDPPCAAMTEGCTAEAVCVPLPVARDAGAVTVAGMAIPLEMSAGTRTKNYANPATPPLPHPGFEPGAALTLSAAGGELEPFELRGFGISLLEVTTRPIDVRSGTATTVTWAVPDEAGPAHVVATLNIDVHGGGDAWIECDVPDTGSLEIPAGLIDALFERGRSGFPTLTLARQSATSTEIAAGCVELLVRSEQVEDVVVEGITSCRVSEECPSGQTCRPIERFCE